MDIVRIPSFNLPFYKAPAIILYNRKDLIFLEKQLQQIAKLAVNESISKLAVEFIIKYSLSDRLSLADAFIASTAIHYDFPLFTLNVKDFRYIDGLQLYPSL